MIRILLLADTHCGFDLPARPRVERRRRGHDFQRNYLRALAPARRGEVDLVVHGGDLFFRSRIPAHVVELGLRPLVEVAAGGVPVFLVPGNHERGRIPRHLWSAHPNLHIFESPSTFTRTIRGRIIALSGFPFVYRGRDRFSDLVAETGHAQARADLKLLCLHLAVEGAQVGAHNYTFRAGPEVVPAGEIPTDFAAVLSGHIHRHQVLTKDLAGRPLAAPVIYPGSVERTSFAERKEQKGYVLLEFQTGGGSPGSLVDQRFVPLPARPMVEIQVCSRRRSQNGIRAEIQAQILRLESNSIVRVRLADSDSLSLPLSAAELRALAPPEMNIQWSGRFLKAADPP
jgi:exonuclease SbcD